MSRRGTVRRYSLADESSFHAKIAENPNDSVASSVFADWLDENNHPAKAAHVRNAASDGVRTWKVNPGGKGWALYHQGNLRDDLHLVELLYNHDGKVASWQRVIPREEVNDAVDSIANEGVPLRHHGEGYTGAHVIPEDPDSQFSRRRAARYERPVEYADNKTTTTPGLPTARYEPKPQPKPVAQQSANDAISEDLRTFRQQVRPKHAMGGPNTVKPNTPEERALLAQHAQQRGLKVEPSQYTYYDDATHTLYHPTPNDHAAVGEAYVRMGGGKVKLRRKAVKYASYYEGPAPEPEPEVDDDIADTDEYYDQPDEDDYFVRTYPSQHEVYQSGHRVLTTHSSNDPAPLIRQHADTANFWPNAWIDHGHGNYELIQYSRTKKRLTRRVVRYAKADTRHEAHPLVAGFPLEGALRHLANDASASPDLRDTAKHVLTTGDTSGLWALNDLVQQHENKDGTTGHPILAAGYNFMSAADKLHLDRHTHDALTELANDARRKGRHADGAQDWVYTPEYHAMRAGVGLSQEYSRMPHLQSEHDKDLNFIRKRVKKLSPQSSDADIDESIRRHVYRGNAEYARRMRVDNEDESRSRTIKPPGSRRHEGSRFAFNPSEEQVKNEKATRYARITLSAPRTSTSYTGSQVNEHDLLDHTGSKVGSVTIIPRNEGKHLHVQWIGAGEQNTGNVLGAEAMRTALSSLRTHYPDAEYVSGLRTSGFRNAGSGRDTNEIDVNKPQERTVVALPKRKPLQRRVVKYAKPNRSDFLDALRRLKSSNHTALTDAAESVASRMGVGPTKIYPALHDTPHGAVPGVAQAVYSTDARPETIHALAAWVNGLLPNGPGYAVFHARSNGPDTLYRMRHEGSGMDVRVRLDRAGITSRILVPHRKGFDVIIPDKGNKLSQNVLAYANQHGLPLEASPGHFQTVGNADQSQARATMRNKVVSGERQQMKRTGKVSRYMQDHDDLIEAARKPLDKGEGSHLGVIADFLQEQGRPGANLAREGMLAKQNRFRVHEPGLNRGGRLPLLGGQQNHWIQAGNITLYPRTTTRKKVVHLGVTHNKDNGTISERIRGLNYEVPVLSRQHLSHLVNDFPPEVQAEVHRRMDEHLPETHESPQQLTRKRVVRRYAEVPTKPGEEWIKDFKVPVSYDSPNGTVGVAHYAPKRHTGSGKWVWKQLEHLGFVRDHQQAKELFPNVMTEDEFFNEHKTRGFKSGHEDEDSHNLTPEEIYLATDGKEGTPPASQEQDWRPNEVIPEDYYAMRRRRLLCPS